MPTVIRAKTLSPRPRIVYTGSTANALDIKADHVTIRGLAVGPTQRNVDGIRIFGRTGITVEDCEFSGLGGIAVVANHTSNQGLIVRRNTIRDSEATAMYFGCHDGITCVATDSARYSTPSVAEPSLCAITRWPTSTWIAATISLPGASAT